MQFVYFQSVNGKTDARGQDEKAKDNHILWRVTRMEERKKSIPIQNYSMET
jgi:hypothetical protein